MKKFYITTAIVYPNSRMHLGFAWEVISSDMIARFKRINNYDVYFCSGMDEHSQNVEKKALSLNKEPKEYCDEMANDIKNVFKLMNISNNRFIRTSDEDHEKLASKLIQKAFDKGDIYKKNYGGYYCDSCEVFYTEKELINENSCPVHKLKVSWKEEENYFFKLEKYQKELLELHENNESNKYFLQPDSRRQEILNFIKTGLRDFSVSRNSFKWGIPLPFDKEHVIYVWYDALVNYLTAIQHDEKYWDNTIHVIGKDITRFHSIYWPAMLMSAGIKLPKKVFAHGFLNLKGEKMSSSRGNFVTPDEIISKYGSDQLRYYLLADNNFSSDGNFSIENLENRINADLVNDLGNLISRTLSMQKKYYSCAIEKPSQISNDEFITQRDEIYNNFETLIDNFELNNYIKSIWQLVSSANKYIVVNEPWRLVKENPSRLQEVMYNLLDTIYFIAVSVFPVIPQTSIKILELLNVNIKEDEIKLNLVKEVYSYNQSSIKDDNYKIFEKIEKKAKEKINVSKIKNLKPEISFEDFNKIDLREAVILSAEKIENTSLYKLIVDVGEKRQVVSKISKFYPNSEDLVGKSVVFLANLKPVEIMGIKSQGMILAASKKKKLSLLTLDKSITPGCKIS